MKLKELKNILYSNRGNIQSAIVWNIESNADLANGCSIDYAVEHLGELELLHIEAFKDNLLLTVK